jgi:hypothetical protein
VQHGDLALGDARLARAEPFSPKDRKRIAKYLYGERSWTMARIGAALNVSRETITKDLQGLVIDTKPPRPKGGRPKSRSKPERPRHIVNGGPDHAHVLHHRGDVTALRRNLAVESRSAPASALCSIWIVL